MVLLRNFLLTKNLYDGDTYGPLFLSESKGGKLVIHGPKVHTFQLEHVLVLESVSFTLNLKVFIFMGFLNLKVLIGRYALISLNSLR